MKILVLGASQGTGAETVKAALAQGNAVTAFARSPDKLAIQHPQLTRLKGDVFDKASVAAAVKGHDAVVVTAFPGSLKGFKERPNFFSEATAIAIDAMKQHGVKRLVVLSALGAGESSALLNPLLQFLLLKLFLKAPYSDHGRQEALVKESGLEWVIARPSRLTDGPANGRYEKTAELKKVPSLITRADVGAFMAEACVTDTWVGKAVQLGG
jgi:putative NADH-flavin reductase